MIFGKDPAVTTSQPGPAAFDELTGELDYPMLVVTVRVNDTNAGCLVGFATQCSIDPPRYAIGLSDKNRTHQVTMNGAERLTAHLVGRDRKELARLFGEETGDKVDKFARCRWHLDERGAVILDDAAAWFSGAVVDRVPAGDHTLFIIEIDAADRERPLPPLLTFREVADLYPGHEA
jgi:flavin reductase (DIM6/NTAB) family NADH-FMN oxidoreductase RutF